jgi:hypothetical protein
MNKPVLFVLLTGLFIFTIFILQLLNLDNFLIKTNNNVNLKTSQLIFIIILIIIFLIIGAFLSENLISQRGNFST